MTHILTRWYRKYFSDPEGIILAVLLLAGFAVVIFMGNMLAPVLASVVIAYLLEGLISQLELHRFHRLTAVLTVFVPFLFLVLVVVLGLFPLLVGQVTQLVHELPNMIARGQQMLQRLPEMYPALVTERQVDELMASLRSTVGLLGQNVVSISLASLSGVFVLVVYLILVPVLVFFFLKDKTKIINWVTAILPRERGLATRVWHEMDQQIGNYVRGKFVEILIVGLVSYAVFALLDLEYAMLLGALVGISVLIPYIGAAVVTLPVLVIAYFQWGFENQFIYIAVAYGVIQALDGNLLVPWLFSEAVNLHPVAIITAVLVFGGIWGLWGVFFAIPLATLVKAVINAWPRSADSEARPEEVPSRVAGGRN